MSDKFSGRLTHFRDTDRAKYEYKILTVRILTRITTDKLCQTDGEKVFNKLRNL